jgi:hypothetical protein
MRKQKIKMLLEVKFGVMEDAKVLNPIATQNARDTHNLSESQRVGVTEKKVTCFISGTFT